MTSYDIAQRVGSAEQPEGIAEWREMQWCNQRVQQSGGRCSGAADAKGDAEDWARHCGMSRDGSGSPGSQGIT